MTVKRRSLARKRRGSRTHGWGLVHRGSGQKGGAGNAGSGKKADAKKPSNWGRVFGRHGFKAHNPRHVVKENTINVELLEEQLDMLVAEKSATKQGDVYSVDLGKLGYTKLLGSGRVTKKLKISIPAASAGVIKKVKAAGGDVSIP